MIGKRRTGACLLLLAAGCGSGGTGSLPSTSPTPYDARNAPSGVKVAHYRELADRYGVATSERVAPGKVRDRADVACTFTAGVYEVRLNVEDDAGRRNFLLNTRALLESYCPEQLPQWKAAADVAGVPEPSHP